MSRILAILLFGLAAVLGGFGAYAFARKDVQGGPDAAGAILVVAAVIAAVLGRTVLRLVAEGPEGGYAAVGVGLSARA